MSCSSIPQGDNETATLLAQNRAYFDRAANAALDASRSGQAEQSMLWARLAAECAWRMHPGFYTHPPLEAMLRTLGEKLAETTAVDVPILPARKGTAKTWLHLITTAYMIGGHTRLVERLIVNARAINEDQHTILLIDQGKNPVPAWLRDAAESSGGALIKLPVELSLVDRAYMVRRIALDWADRVLLHIHPEDPVASVAFALSGGPPVIYVNHADHLFWLGAGCSDIVADIRPEGHDVTATRRGNLQSMIVPIPLELPESSIPVADARCSLGIPSNMVVLVAIASSYKFAPYGQLDFPSTAVTILQKHTDTILIVVGPTSSDPLWQSALELTSGRIRLLGIQSDIEQYYAVADIFLESFPLGSLTSTFDAMLRGVPVIRAPHGAPPLFTMSDYDGLGDNSCNIQEYLLRVSALITDPLLRRKTGLTQRDAVTAIHTGSGWLDAWQQLIVNLPASHTIRPDVKESNWDSLSDLDFIWVEFSERQSVLKPDKALFFKKRIRTIRRKTSRGLLLYRVLRAVAECNWRGAGILLRNIKQLKT